MWGICRYNKGDSGEVVEFEAGREVEEFEMISFLDDQLSRLDESVVGESDLSLEPEI